MSHVNQSATDWCLMFSELILELFHTVWCLKLLLQHDLTCDLTDAPPMVCSGVSVSLWSRPPVSLSLTGGGTGCPRSLSTSVLAADWPTTRGCRRSKGRSFDMTGRPTAAPPTHTHTAHAGVWPCCRDTHSLRTCDTWCSSQSHVLSDVTRPHSLITSRHLKEQ